MKLDAKAVARLTLPDGKTDAIQFDSELVGFGLRLRSSGGRVRRNWIVQYRVHGRTRRVLVGAFERLTADEARKAATKILAKVALGHDPQGEKETKRRDAAHTFRSVAEAYLEAKKAKWRDRTLIDAERYLTGLYFKSLHTAPMAEITRADVSLRLRAIIRENGNVAAARARSAISSMFSWALGEGLVDGNPTIGTNQPELPAPREHVLDDSDLAAIWRVCGDDDYGRVMKLLMLLGARRAEVGGMEWKEIDLDRGSWTIPAARVKNHRQHTLPMPQMALDIIAAIPRVNGRTQLFGVRGEGGFSNWTRAKRELDERSGVKEWTVHDLRRTAATRMCDLGVAPHVVEQILNHQSGHRAGIVGVYNRSSYDREVRAALSRWNDHIRALVEGGDRKIIPMPR